MCFFFFRCFFCAQWAPPTPRFISCLVAAPIDRRKHTHHRPRQQKQNNTPRRRSKKPKKKASPPTMTTTGRRRRRLYLSLSRQRASVDARAPKGPPPPPCFNSFFPVDKRQRRARGEKIALFKKNAAAATPRYVHFSPRVLARPHRRTHILILKKHTNRHPLCYTLEFKQNKKGQDSFLKKHKRPPLALTSPPPLAPAAPARPPPCPNKCSPWPSA